MVFCGDCRYLHRGAWGHECHHPNNIERVIDRGWNWKERKKAKFIYTRKPPEINKNNDCQWYGQRISWSAGPPG